MPVGAALRRGENLDRSRTHRGTEAKFLVESDFASQNVLSSLLPCGMVCHVGHIPARFRFIVLSLNHYGSKKFKGVTYRWQVGKWGHFYDFIFIKGNDLFKNQDIQIVGYKLSCILFKKKFGILRNGAIGAPSRPLKASS